MTFTLYIKTYCPYSKNAINLLKKKKIKHIVHDVEKYGGIQPVMKELKRNGFISKSSKHGTVPIVFDGKKFIGGYTELERYLAKY